MTRHTTHMRLDAKRLARANELLHKSGLSSKGTLDVVTVQFPKGFEADIKLVGGDEDVCWVDAVLFEQGREVSALACDSETLDGTYCWEVDGDEFVVILE